MRYHVVALGFLVASSVPFAHAAEPRTADSQVERGRYMVKTAGCNECHTESYAEKNGEVPEQEWLTGVSTGWRGPWGTTYAINLRLFMQTLNEDQWLTYARNKPSRPPMPWYALRDMEDSDLRAIYRFVRYLGPAGASAPGYVPPDQPPATAFISFVPQQATVKTEVAPAAPEAAPKAEEKEHHWWDFDIKSSKPNRPPTEKPGQ